ncbi:ionic transporter y4hA [Nocardioides sp. HDW12B]|uniref:calcium:proton antiporter n=1 Tax=Nocardioides sp. HDW12B TaxID=2714939 RepID=UPI001407DD29|nr:ionic transporter y4hA [Nocardioides sp. HDW12B]QIK65218.1 ionic transporter y4hA [Nocardioides sp. HDW12B]
MAAPPKNPAWSVAAPVLGLVVLAATWNRELPVIAAALVGLVLAGAVMTAVHHAEMVAAKVGEPFGTLILAVAVTVIEVALILTLMLTTPDEAATLARDTAFAAVMIILTGVIGACLLAGTIKHHAQDFKADGASGAISGITVLVTLTLVLPAFTTSTNGATYTTAQLLVMSAIALTIYGVFVLVQTSRHRDYFLPDEAEGDAEAAAAHPEPSTTTARNSLLLLIACLVAVVGLSKTLSPNLKDVVSSLGAPASTVGVLIAVLVLAPETVAAMRAAAANRLQTSMNLAVGSGMASIGLTIPTIAVASLFLDVPLELGLGAPQIVLLTLAVFISGATVLLGRVTVLQGTVHLSVFAAFLFLAFVP